MGTLHGLQLLVPLPYPATEDFREAEALCLAYAALRLAIPFCGKAFGQVWTAGLCLAGLYQTYTGITQLAGWEPSHHYRYALTGTFFNPGPYAILVAIALAVAAAWLYNHKGAWTGLSRPDKVSRATVYALWQPDCRCWPPHGAARHGWLWR